MRGQFQLSKRAPHPPLRGTFSPWEKGQTTPSFLTFRFRATAFRNRLTGQRCPLWPPGLASPTTFATTTSDPEALQRLKQLCWIERLAKDCVGSTLPGLKAMV